MEKRTDFETQNFLNQIKKMRINSKQDPDIISDYINGHVVQTILEIMNQKDISQQELAKKINKSRQYVSRILKENQNFTIYSLSLFSCALDCDLEINIKPNKKINNKKYSRDFLSCCENVNKDIHLAEYKKEKIFSDKKREKKYDKEFKIS